MNELVFLNPLPQALQHYALALQHVTKLAGFASTIGLWPSAELRGEGRLAAAVGHLHAKVRLGHTSSYLLLWPSLGWLDALKPPQGRLSVIVHDPIPLRAQPFLGPTTGRLVARAPRALSAQIIVHSESARQVVADYGYRDILVLPHPVQSHPASPASSNKRVVRVLGAYKPARDLEILRRLATQLPDWDLEIHGRGWPQVPGWQVHPEFVSEQTLSLLIETSGVVLIPYVRYFQSGIAIRALEHFVPVVGGRGTYIEELLGGDYPGLADGPDDWGAAVLRADGFRPMLAKRVDLLERQVVARWSTWLNSAGEV